MAMDGAIQEVMELLKATGIAESDYAVYVRGMSDIDLHNLRQALQQKILGSDTFVQDVTQRAQGGPPSLRAAAKATEPVMVQRPPRRAFRLALAGCAASLVMAVTAHVVVLMQRVTSLEQTVIALSQENEAEFRAQQHSATVRASVHRELSSLRGTRWDIRITPLVGVSDAPKQDELTFDEQHMASVAMAGQGFAQSPYVLSEGPEGRSMWETAQTNAQGDLMLWQGEWQGPVMHGRLTRQPVGRPAERFTFVAVLRDTAPARSEI
jgi:hypothetical protein